MNRSWWSTLRVAMGLALCSGAGLAREALDLGGAWQYQKVGQLSYPPPATGWQATTVPGYLSGSPYEQAWFKRTFTPPASWTGGRAKLRFGGVKYRSTVWLNGQLIGGCTNGYNPFSLDVTAALLPGQANTLIVGLTDWTGLFSSPVDFSNLAPGEGLRDRAQNVVLAPIGGHYNLYGIWEDVTLAWQPEVFVADVFVQPSVQDGLLKAVVRIANESASAASGVLSNAVPDGGAGGLTLPPQSFGVAPGSTQTVVVTVPWPNARLWSPEDPFLYQLSTALEVNGSPGDSVNTRFGFRDFKTSGEHLLVNGTNIHLRATSCWPPVQPMTRAAIRQVLLDVKAGNNNAFRLHTQPWPELWYDVADEVGLLIVEEAAVWCDPRAYRLSDPVFWGHYAEHLTAAVARDQNHPSIVLWSLENEILHCGGDGLSSSAVQELAKLGLLVKSLDPTRPITYEADLDPGGVADVLGLHYPHEFPDFVQWPDTAYWMDQPLKKSYAPGGSWIWDRTKPLYIGEFLWVPATAAQGFTILYGDPAYADPHGYRNLAKALTWRMQIEAYRDYGVSAFCPWTMFEDPAASGTPIVLNPDQNLLYQAQAAVYHPNAIFIREYDTRFFAGENVERTLKVYNDTPGAGDFTLRWGVNGAAASRALTLEAAGRSTELISFTAPAEPGGFNLNLELWRGQSLVYSNAVAFEAYTKADLRLPSGIRLGLYDPSNTTTGVLRSEGVPFVTVTNLLTENYEQFNVLMIGKDALAEEPVPTVGAATVGSRWREFATRGGWVLVMEQSAYPSWMPLGLTLANEPSHFAFPTGSHPVVSGLRPEDLRWWRPGHRVAHRPLRIPTRGNFQVLAHSGSAQGLDQAVLLEARWARGGGVLCSQARLTEACSTEPMARLLWQRLLDYCVSAPLAVHAAAGALTETNSAAATALRQVGLLAENVAGRLAGSELSRFPTLLVAGGAGVWDEARLNLTALAGYVEAGGVLWLHRPAESFLAAATNLLRGSSWETNLALPVLRRDASRAPDGLTSHDLYWVDDPGSWNRNEVLATNIASRAYRMPFTLTNYTVLQAESMPIKTGGSAVSQGWVLSMNGYLAQDITVAAGGLYQLGVQARGTPAFGIAAQLIVRVDGILQDAVSVTNTTGWQLYPLAVEIPTGTHRLALSFENDAYNPPSEDRNLYLDQVWYGPSPAVDAPELLTRPGVLAEIRRGAGCVLLDEIQWENPGPHSAKAERVLSTLGTRVGALLAPPTGLRIEAEAMQPSGFPGTGLVVTNNGLVWYYANGVLSTSVRFNATGSYRFDIAGRGAPAAGVYPRVDLRLDGARRATVEVASASVASVSVTISVSAGVHTVSLAFVNDAVIGGEDRNLALDFLQIRAESSPEILRTGASAETGTLDFSWSGEPGRRYGIWYSADVTTGWQSVDTNLLAGDVGHWTDDGTVTGGAPGGVTRPHGYYRVQTLP